ncbi:L,D-transpeptidase [Salipiger sp. IMCC34102]|uniref:L,D-transpeptidase n=1 Tax=Salipiger sp. IMCC34102 TaxID=2510647 RepID=UPI00101DBCD9|nr:L,D-transpeptidase [Salipiger sp. IMCC34102]RYH04190.1 L,D-transpeptidase [Salipiger sp. IMCC34102]
MTNSTMTRRGLLASGAALLASPALAQANSTEMETNIRGGSAVVRNVASFRAMDWRPHFDTLAGGAILVDLQSRALHYWSEDQQIYKLYPTSVPLTEDLTRRGKTEIIKKVDGPSWAPTPSMKERNPDWPDFIGPGPDNPLGTHALWLTWQYYRIHGTHDTRKIGRRSSNGCIGLYNEHIAELFSMTQVGTQVVVL